MFNPKIERDERFYVSTSAAPSALWPGIGPGKETHTHAHRLESRCTACALVTGAQPLGRGRRPAPSRTNTPSVKRPPWSKGQCAPGQTKFALCVSLFLPFHPSLRLSVCLDSVLGVCVCLSLSFSSTCDAFIAHTQQIII